MKRAISSMLCLALSVSLCGCSMLDYKKAVMLYEGGAYEGAKELFEALEDYKDSAEYAARAQLILDYRNAVELYAGENWAGAAELFEALGDYEDSAEYLKKVQDKLLAEKLIGRWQTDELDMTDIFIGAINEELEAMGYSEVDFGEVERISLSEYYSFEEYGVVNVGASEDAIVNYFGSMLPLIKDLMINLSEQDLLALCEEYAISYEDLLLNLGVADVEEYLEYTMGMSFEEFEEIYIEEARAYAQFYKVSGAWYVRDGMIYIVSGEEHEEAEYNAEKDCVTVLSGHLSDEEIEILYPFDLTRADEDKPEA